jgi:hypothetical protein
MEGVLLRWRGQAILLFVDKGKGVSKNLVLDQRLYRVLRY